MLFTCLREVYQVRIYERRPDMRKTALIFRAAQSIALSKRGWTALEKVNVDEYVRDIAITNA